jgi:hypothetical protein
VVVVDVVTVAAVAVVVAPGVVVCLLQGSRVGIVAVVGMREPCRRGDHLDLAARRRHVPGAQLEHHHAVVGVGLQLGHPAKLAGSHERARLRSCRCG